VLAACVLFCLYLVMMSMMMMMMITMNALQRSDIGGIDAYGNTVLHVAAYSGHAGVCRQIIVQQQTERDDVSGMTPLIDILNRDGCSPIDLAKSKPTRR